MQRQETFGKGVDNSMKFGVPYNKHESEINTNAVSNITSYLNSKNLIDEMPIIDCNMIRTPAAKKLEALIPQNPMGEEVDNITNARMQRCQYCYRNFNIRVAQRHIPICEKTNTRANPPPSKS